MTDPFSKENLREVHEENEREYYKSNPTHTFVRTLENPDSVECTKCGIVSGAVNGQPVSFTWLRKHPHCDEFLVFRTMEE